MNKISKLFKETFLISAFTIGGGYVIIPLMQKKFVQKLGWISEDEMLDLVTIAQTLPGVMAVNASIIIGHKVAGFKGALVCLLATILPPFIILSIISFFYDSFINNSLIKSLLLGMQVAVAAIIVNASYTMYQALDKSKALFNVSVILVTLFLNLYFKISVIYLIVLAIILSLIINIIERKKVK